ncbi:cupin-like domain-containing protein [Fulvivirga sp.]|uniref:cupin-like domain-containing protein n=1 Tax=Fulvivirga sp. TaxID=1931237 RepID=UPI0032EC8AD7
MTELVNLAKKLYQPIDRVAHISKLEFEQKYASLKHPLAIEDMTSKWPALKQWNLESWNDKLGNYRFMAVKSDTGSKKEFSYNEYLEYLKCYDHRHPYYIKDWTFYEDFEDMKNDYQVLPHFENWLWSLPPDAMEFTWIYIGPKYSYSKIHLDVFMTNAWNVVVEGAKLWLFFPEGQAPEISNDDPNGYYFPYDGKTQGYYTIQRKGEIVFTPGNWHHMVINLEHSIALTENFINHTNYEMVEDYLRKHNNNIALGILDSLKSKFFVNK